MKNNSDLKIIVRDGKVVTLKEWYKAHQRTHAEQANLPFEEKIKILVSLQQLAFSWGKKTDIIVWKINS